MLKDLLNCFLGRVVLVAARLGWAPIGDPFARPVPVLALEKKRRERDPPAAQSELSKGFLSCGGDSLKHSSRDDMDVPFIKPLPPAPKVKVGN
jgi:hypothetical protein